MGPEEQQKREIALIGWGKTSTPFAGKIAGHLRETFGFEVFMPDNHPELRACFLDTETRLGRPAEEYETRFLDGKAVYIVQDTRIYDARLLFAVQKLAERLKDSRDEDVRSLLKEIEGYVAPDLDIPRGPMFASVEHHPDRLITKICGTIGFVRDCGARYVALASRKSSYEWSHKHGKALRVQRRWEMRGLEMMINNFAIAGANTLMLLHPHAPNEGRFFCKERGMHYVDLNPQGMTYVDDEPKNLELLLLEKYPGVELNRKFLVPFDFHIESHQDDDGYYRPDRCFIVAPDEGALVATGEFARKHGLERLSSKCNRFGEGDKRAYEFDDIRPYLSKLIERDPNAAITFIILDDKINTGGTANKEALIRREQVMKFNKEYGTNFTARIELWCAHLRTPYLRQLKHDNLDSLVFMDTVPYFPYLQQQLEILGITDKTTLLHGASYLIACGIALDYQLHARQAISGPVQ